MRQVRGVNGNARRSINYRTKLSEVMYSNAGVVKQEMHQIVLAKSGKVVNQERMVMHGNVHVSKGGNACRREIMQARVVIRKSGNA